MRIVATPQVQARHLHCVRAVTCGVVLALLGLACVPVAALAAGAKYSVNGRLLPEHYRAPVLYSGTLEIRIEASGSTALCTGVTMSGTIWNENGRGVSEIEGLGGGNCDGFLSYGSLTSEQWLLQTSRAVVDGEEVNAFVPGHRSSLLPWRGELSSKWSEEEEAEVPYVTIGVPPKGQKCPDQPGCFSLDSLEGGFDGEHYPGGPREEKGTVQRSREEHRGEILQENWFPWEGSATGEWINGERNGLSPSHFAFWAQELTAEGFRVEVTGHFVVAGFNDSELIQAVVPWS